MKIQLKLTSRCVFECFQVAIIAEIGHSSELELILLKITKVARVKVGKF
jgi:hypothetical protein